MQLCVQRPRRVEPSHSCQILVFAELRAVVVLNSSLLLYEAQCYPKLCNQEDLHFLMNFLGLD